MEVNEAKIHLLDKLISLEDKEVLEKISQLLENVNVEKGMFTTSDSQKQMLMESEQDYKAGKTIPDDELNAEEDKWLNE